MAQMEVTAGNRSASAPDDKCTAYLGLQLSAGRNRWVWMGMGMSAGAGVVGKALCIMLDGICETRREKCSCNGRAAVSSQALEK